MSITINNTEFDQLRQLIENECGIAIGEDKVYLLETRLSKLAIENGCENFGSFYTKAKMDMALRAKIVDSMTTNETLWFRDQSPYNCMQKFLFPQFAQQLKAGTRQQVRIWSAACSTGQEPYSIGITAHEYNRLNPSAELTKKMSITATDISTTALFLAKAARYDGISMSRGMPDDLRHRYFTENGRVSILNDDIKKMVQFQQFNLMKPFDTLGGRFDLILLRNVAIYFSTEFKIDLFRRLARSLNPDGYLIVGASESLMGYSQDFNLVRQENCQIYQVKKL